MIAAAGLATGVAGAVSSRKQGKQALDQQKEAADRQAEIAERQQDIAEEQYGRYKQVYQPIEDQFVAESQNFGSIANQNKEAKDAAAAVKGAYVGAREQLARAPGINTNSQAYLQEANRINLAEAATTAATQNKARADVVAKGRAYATDALSLGKGMSANAASTLANAGSAYGSIGSTYGNMASGAYGRAADTMSGIGSIGKMVGGMYQSGALDRMGNTVGNWLGVSQPAGINNPSAYQSGGTPIPYMVDTNTYTPNIVMG